MPPMSAAASPRRSVSGPMLMSSVDPRSVAVSSTAMADRNPAIDHTAVETSLGLMPVIRARSALLAAARTWSPNLVWLSSHHKPRVTSGTTIRISSWAALTSMPNPGCHSPSNGRGNWVCRLPVR